MEMQEGSREEKEDWDTTAAHIAQVTGAFSTRTRASTSTRVCMCTHSHTQGALVYILKRHKTYNKNKMVSLLEYSFVCVF